MLFYYPYLSDRFSTNRFLRSLTIDQTDSSSEKIRENLSLY